VKKPEDLSQFKGEPTGHRARLYGKKSSLGRASLFCEIGYLAEPK